MRYVVRGFPDPQQTGGVTAEAVSKEAALERALALRLDGLDNVTVMDETGRMFTLSQFELFCASQD